MSDKVKAALRKRVDHLLHVQFERGKYETAEFARLHWDNKQSWPTLNDALMQAIEETLQPEIERLVASELKNLINDDTIVYWNDDRDDDGHIFISDLRERVKALTKSNQKDHLK